MIDYRDFFAEVIQTHVEIEQWFAGVAPQGTLENLLARFSPDFSMIAPSSGARVDAAGVRDLFNRLGGQRPGLKITLSEMSGIDRHARGATVTYREHQVDDSGAQTDRRATVVFEKQASGALLWRHLHETYCQG
ncbi:nuclear transport factor 2 family protein [Pseudomonas sp. 15FMM2]|uniref:Nuclear transport factor 2 family protein n=1 Tax=Pseudomonas imrae TaxID=2992837 RepID=A0ACC7PEK5_9PSED